MTCLSVTGNRAVIGMFRPDPIIGDTSIYRLVVDGGPGGTDTVGVDNAVGRPLDCATIAIDVDPSLPVSGDAIVTDAKPLPTTKSRCRNGNWRTYAVFRNQGDCVSFVATKGKNPPSGPSPGEPGRGYWAGDVAGEGGAHSRGVRLVQ